MISTEPILLHFLTLAFLVSRLTPQPYTHKSHPPGNRDPYTSNPYPTSTDLPAPWPFVMSKMSNRYFPLYVHIGKEWSLVIDSERKDAMLVWKLERSTEYGTVWGLRNGCKIETMIGREHGKFQLQSVRGVNLKRFELIVRILGYFDVERLWQRSAHWVADFRKKEFTYYVVFDTVDLGVQISQLGYTIIASCISRDGAEVMLNSADL